MDENKKTVVKPPFTSYVWHHFGSRFPVWGKQIKGSCVSERRRTTPWTVDSTICIAILCLLAPYLPVIFIVKSWKMDSGLKKGLVIPNRADDKKPQNKKLFKSTVTMFEIGKQNIRNKTTMWKQEKSTRFFPRSSPPNSATFLSWNISFRKNLFDLLYNSQKLTV